MTDRDDVLLSAAISAVESASAALDAEGAPAGDPLQWIGREPKAGLDLKLNAFLVGALRATSLPVLSEEGGHSPDWRGPGAMWILDPLDGTFNFMRGAGPSAISLALWRNGQPVFGVVLDIGSRAIAWGGREMGSRTHDTVLHVSRNDTLSRCALCTGIPATFDFSDAQKIANWTRLMALFGKIRMIGSAASSLLMVARGAADCYYEHNIRIWDVAAGMALLEGAGGVCRILPGADLTAIGFVAANPQLWSCIENEFANMLT